MLDDMRFRPFDDRVDRDVALRLLRDATTGADDAELYLEHVRSENLVFDDRKLKNASYNVGEGFGLRGVSQDVVGFSHSTDISAESIARAGEIARLAISGNQSVLAPVPASTNRRVYTDADPVSAVDFPGKLATLREIDEFARGSDRRVIEVSASLTSSYQQVEILRPEGDHCRDLRPMARLNVSVVVEDGDRRETGTAGTGGRIEIADLLQRERWEALVREAIRIARVNLRAVAAPAGVMEVALGPGWPGILLHEAVGHGLEGDFNRRKTSVFSELLGQRVAAPGVTVIDDGTIPDRRGSISVDDEGTPSGRTVLIEDGILVGYLQDRQNARLMGVDPTGNGRRQGFGHAPMPRMTNTFMQSGTANPSDIIADVSDGIHAVGFGGGQVDITSGKFVFSCTEAYRIKDGVVGEPVKGATLIGDGATALKTIRAIGNDMQLDPGVGTCGKAGQWVPVGVGQPTILVDGLTVGGSSL